MLLELELLWLLVLDLFFNGFLLRDLDCIYFNYQIRKSSVLLFIVIIFPCQDWVICASAVFFGCGSRFSGFFSGIEF